MIIRIEYVVSFIMKDKRLKRKHPADLTKDITQQTRGWYPAGDSHQHVNKTAKKFDLMSKMDKLRIIRNKYKKIFITKRNIL